MSVAQRSKWLLARAYPPTFTSMLSTGAFFSTSLSKKLGPFAGVARPFLPPPGPLHAVANAACFSASSASSSASSRL